MREPVLMSSPTESVGTVSSPSNAGLAKRLQTILGLVTDAQNVLEDPNMVETDGHTRWYLSESTLGLAKVLLRTLIAERKE